MEGTEVDEEPEKMSTKHRRSSILKMPKNRNPFGEVDVPESCAETTMLKTTRRVSFASSNLVKPFVADPDKNTIWDTTYEEEINHTDSTQSSQEQSNKINSTFFNSLKTPLNSMQVSTVDMDITKGHLLIDKENIPQCPRISIVDYAKKLSTNSCVPLFSLPSHNDSLFSTETMEFTCQNLNPFVKANGLEAEDICEMELTEISLNDLDEITNKSFYGTMKQSLVSEMDFTCQVLASKTEMSNQIPSPISETPSDICQMFQPDGHADNEIKAINGSYDKLSIPERTCVDMNITCQDNGLSKTDNTFGGDMEFTCQLPVSNSCKVPDKMPRMEKSFGNDMEFTCQLPIICQSHELSKPEKSVNMELTCQVVPPNVEKVTSKMSKTDKSFFKQCQDDEVSKSEQSIDCGMELTCQIPPEKGYQEISNVKKSFADDMEFTCQIPLSNLPNMMSKAEKSFITSQVVSKLEKSVGYDMELTCQIPTIRQINSVSKTEKSLEYDMEFTCQISSSDLRKPSDGTDELIKCQDDEASKSEKSCTMEFTCQIPTVCQTNEASKPEKSICDMEFMCQLPSNFEKFPNMMSKTEKSFFTLTNCQKDMSKSEKSVDCDMEFTCQIPASNWGKVFDGMSKSEKTVVGDMDLTCHIPLKEHKLPEFSTKEKRNKEFDCQIRKQRSDAMTQNDILGISGINSVELTKNHELLKTEGMDFSYIPYTNQASSANKTEITSNCQILNNVEMTTANIGSCRTSNFALRGKQSSKEVEKTFVNNQSDCQNGAINPAEVSKMKTSSMDISFQRSVTGPVSTAKSPLRLSKIPVRSPSRKNLINEDDEVINKEQSALDLTPTNDVYPPKSILYSQKIPSLQLLPSKHNLSCLQTPESSFHINLTNISSGVDDTQHLLRCTYTKILPECLMASRCETKECICPISEEIGEVSTPKLTNLSQYDFNETAIDEARNSSGSQDLTLTDIKRSRLATVNDTYVLARRNVLKNKSDETKPRNANTYTINTEDLEDKDTSLGLLDEKELASDLPDTEEIEDKDINLLNRDLLVDNPVEQKCVKPIFMRKEHKIKEFNFTIRRVAEVSPLIERIEQQRKQITEFLENFRLREIKIPSEFVITEKSSSEESEFSLEKSCKTTEDVHPTVEEKIRKRQESSQNTWQLEQVDDEFYHFSTLFGTLIFIVELNLESGKVLNITTKNNLDNDDPKALYIMKLFLEKLDGNHIKAAIGEHFDVLSLLDYVQMTTLKLIRLQEDIMNCRHLTLTKDYIAKFRILSVPLTLICEISLDVRDLENLNFEDMKVCVEKGTMNENEFKKFVKGCPKGYSFFSDFTQCIDEYLRMKDKRKKFAKRNL